MITVPPGVQATLAAYTDGQLKSAVSDALDQVAYGLWEARRRGYSVTAVYETAPGVLNQDEALEILVTASKQVQL